MSQLSLAPPPRLAQLADSVCRVFVCHFMRLENEPVLLREVAEGFDRIVDGSALYRESVDSFQYPFREACFDNFSVYLAGDTGAPRV